MTAPRTPDARLLFVKALGLLLVLIVGYQFYRGFTHSYRRFEKQGERIARVSEDYVRALFQTMGHLAKVDGRVSEDEIRAARLVMHRLGLKPGEVRRAIGWFTHGKGAGFSIAPAHARAQA